MSQKRVHRQGLGAALSSADLAAVRRFLEEFTVRSLLPHLEARLRAVNFQVPSAPLPARNGPLAKPQHTAMMLETPHVACCCVC